MLFKRSLSVKEVRFDNLKSVRYITIIRIKSEFFMPLELNLPHPNPESLRQGAHVAGGVMVVLGYVVSDKIKKELLKITPENYTPRVLRIKNL